MKGSERGKFKCDDELGGGKKAGWRVCQWWWHLPSNHMINYKQLTQISYPLGSLGSRHKSINHPGQTRQAGNLHMALKLAGDMNLLGSYSWRENELDK